MNCHFCRKETLCTYGLVSTGTLAENYLYCSRHCLDAHSRELGHSSSTERRLTALEQQVAALTTTVEALSGGAL